MDLGLALGWTVAVLVNGGWVIVVFVGILAWVLVRRIQYAPQRRALDQQIIEEVRSFGKYPPDSKERKEARERIAELRARRDALPGGF